MGGNTCTVCTHEARQAVDQALVAGESNRVIASQHGLSQAAVGRHSQNHLSATLVAAAEDRELAHGGKLLDQVQSLVGKALGSLERAEGKGNEREVQGAIREARHSLELVGRLNGDLREANRANEPLTAVQVVLNMAERFTLEELEAMASQPVE